LPQPLLFDPLVLKVKPAVGIDSDGDGRFVGSGQVVCQRKLDAYSRRVNERTQHQKNDQQKKHRGKRRGIQLAAKNTGVAGKLHVFAASVTISSISVPGRSISKTMELPRLTR